MSRQSEIRRIEDLVAAVRAGQSRALVVAGPAGSGKSWLCRRACELADGFNVVVARGVESEVHLGYSGLFDVLSPLLDGCLDRLLPARADALRGALRIADSPVVDPFAVAVATLDLLAMAAGAAPVLVVVDDAPWVDAASLEALRFAARRLDADRVGFLFAARSDPATPLADAGIDTLTVAGLDTPEGVQASARLGLFACWVEDYATARREVERAVALARHRGLVSGLPFALSTLGELEFRVGDWIAARGHAEEAVRLGDDTDQLLHHGHSVLLQLDAVAGEAHSAHAHADTVLRIAARSGCRSLAMHAHAGLGLLELGLDHPDVAIGHLSRTREIAERGNVDEPNHVRWMPDLIESQIRAGLEREAETTLAVLEAQAQRTGRGWALAAAARCRGLLAPPGAADAVFAEARRLVSALPSSFERARTELCWGERLRRDGGRIEARRHLHDALARFESLGAVPWAEKAARELRASGGRAQRGPRAHSDELTAQEMQIAALVAEGRTNRSIADSLFLSPKTIEFHLSHVYRKLDVSNRTQLARSVLIAKH